MLRGGERWKRPDSFRVMKRIRRIALRVLDTQSRPSDYISKSSDNNLTIGEVAKESQSSVKTIVTWQNFANNTKEVANERL